MTNQKISPIKSLAKSARAFRIGMNLWPPLLCTGISITSVSADWTSLEVKLTKNPLTTNIFGTQFGGSIYAMTDPFFVLLLVNQLGSEYIVWDKAAEIEFVRPGKTNLTAVIKVPKNVTAEIKSQAKNGKVLHWFETEILDAEHQLVAKVRKQIYVRLAQPSKNINQEQLNPSV